MSRMGSEFMPALDEGDLLYMPTSDPSISVGKSRELLQQTDKLIRLFPEVVSVHGKIGRADSATDPAPLSMIETVVQLETDKSKWRHRRMDYFFSGWPAWLKWPLTKTFWPESRPISTPCSRFIRSSTSTPKPNLRPLRSAPWKWKILRKRVGGNCTPISRRHRGIEQTSLRKKLARVAAR